MDWKINWVSLGFGLLVMYGFKIQGYSYEIMLIGGIITAYLVSKFDKGMIIDEAMTRIEE